jgi:hypothetical protein
MKWFRIAKESSPRPTSGSSYRDWKEHLLTEGKNQCVYCAININSFGGIRNFHVEHYRPKAKNKFPELINEYSNLFVACSICNCFKGDDWPNEPSTLLDNHAFPDPSKIDYCCFLECNNQAVVESEYITGKYIIQKLFLNRPQLILERRSYYLNEELKRESEKLKNIGLRLKNQYNSDPSIDAMLMMIETTILLIDGNYINPYKAEQTQR